jgi:hypothetical protein
MIGDIFRTIPHRLKGAFPPSHFCNKLDNKLARKVAVVSFVANQFGLQQTSD